MKLSAVVADPWAYIRRARPEPEPEPDGQRWDIDSIPEPYGPDLVVFGPRMSEDNSSENGRPE